MKKYVAAVAALAVVGTAGVMYVNDKMDTESPANETTTSTTSYVQSDDSYTQSGIAVNSDKTTTTTSTTTTEQVKEVSFKAEIDEVSGNTLLLSVDKGNDTLKSGDKVSVAFKNVEVVDTKGRSIKDDDVVNFKDATVYYDGTVMETYPVQVKASKIVLRNRTDCNIYFCLSDGQVIDTITVPVGATIDSADMPNAGAYCDDGYHFEGWQLNDETVYGVEDVDHSLSLVAKIRKD